MPAILRNNYTKTDRLHFAAMFSLAKGHHVHETAGIWGLLHTLTGEEFKNAWNFTSISFFLFKMSSLIRHSHKFTSFPVCMALPTDRCRTVLCWVYRRQFQKYGCSHWTHTHTQHLIVQCTKLTAQRNELIKHIKQTGGTWPMANAKLISEYLPIFVKFIKIIDFTDL